MSCGGLPTGTDSVWSVRQAPFSICVPHVVQKSADPLPTSVLNAAPDLDDTRYSDIGRTRSSLERQMSQRCAFHDGDSEAVAHVGSW
jgi:hypothetical protein